MSELATLGFLFNEQTVRSISPYSKEQVENTLETKSISFKLCFPFSISMLLKTFLTNAQWPRFITPIFDI